MASPDPSFSNEILQTVSGITTAWLPLTTPWVSIAACSSQVYGVFNTGAVVAFDPFYGSVIASNQIPCLPEEATVWWNPPVDGKTVYVLGPTFVCPAAYSAVQTIVVDSATEEVLCCPTSYTLGTILTHNPQTDFPSECYSSCASGETITYMTQSVSDGSWFPFTRTIQSDTFSVYAVHVNGYNVIATTTSSDSSSSLSFASSTSSPTLPSTTPFTSAQTSATTSPSTPALSSGAAAGIGVGVTAIAVVIAILAFLLYQQRKKNEKQHTLEPNSEPVMRQDMEAQNQPLEHTDVAVPPHELQTQNRPVTFELH